MIRPKKQQLFSVWDDGEQRYHIYVANGDHKPRPVPAGPNPHLGAVPEEAADRLPLGARYLGSGDMAHGHVVEPGVNMESLFQAAIYGLAALGIWYLWRKQ